MKNLAKILVFVLTLLFINSTMAQELILYYPFEGQADKVLDQSGNGNDGSYDAGGASRVASKEASFGKAMEFDGASRITVKDGKSLAFSGEYTFVMWAKRKDEAGGTGLLPRIISRAGDLHELAFDSGHLKRGTFAIYFGGNPGWTTCMPVDEDWHHIAVVQDGSAFHTYLDGEDVFELNATGPASFSGDLYIGSRCDLGSAEFYLGLLDELAIYIGALDANGIKKVMTEGVKGQLLAVTTRYKLSTTWGELKLEE